MAIYGLEVVWDAEAIEATIPEQEQKLEFFKQIEEVLTNEGLTVRNGSFYFFTEDLKRTNPVFAVNAIQKLKSIEHVSEIIKGAFIIQIENVFDITQQLK